MRDAASGHIYFTNQRYTCLNAIASYKESWDL